MFEPVKVKKWTCKYPDKIVQTGYIDADNHNLLEARFTLDEIINIKEKLSDLYVILFKNQKREYVVPKRIIEDNFILEFEE